MQSSRWLTEEEVETFFPGLRERNLKLYQRMAHYFNSDFIRSMPANQEPDQTYTEPFALT